MSVVEGGPGVSVVESFLDVRVGGGEGRNNSLALRGGRSTRFGRDCIGINELAVSCSKGSKKGGAAHMLRHMLRHALN